ncbi:UNVERIFIED_CONTAM: hypothetical protein C4Z64_01105 [Clostridioides difficile]
MQHNKNDLKKFVCPKCGGQLIFIQNYGYEIIKKINKTTGKFTGKVVKNKPTLQEWTDIVCIECEFTKTNLEIIESHDTKLQELLEEIETINFKA